MGELPFMAIDFQFRAMNSFGIKNDSYINVNVINITYLYT